MPAAPVTVELLGVARFRAGRPEVRARGGTIRELLTAVIAECPNLVGLITDGGELSREYLVSIDGERFVDDVFQTVPAGCRVLVLGADAGG